MKLAPLIFLTLFSSWAAAQTGPVVPASTKIPMTLKWNSLEGVTSYNVTIARSREFNESRSFKTSKNYLPIMVFPDSHYYWKVSAVNYDERRINQKDIYEFESKNRGSAEARLELNVELTPATAPVETVVAAAPVERLPYVYTPAGYQVGLHLEMGLLDFKQQHSAFGDVAVTGLLFPGVGLDFKTPFYADVVSFEMHFQQIIGDFDSDSPGVTLLDTDFQWLNYGAKATFRVFDSEKWGLRPFAGVSQQKTPFFYSISPTSMTIKELNYFVTEVGLHVDFKGESGWAYYGDVSYALPLSEDGEDLSGVDTSSATFMALDVGGSYKIPNGFYFGGALKGSYKDIKETLSNSTTQSSGTRKVIYYGIELSAGVSF